MLETHARRALILPRGDRGVFVQRPIAAGLPTVAAVYPLLPLLASAWHRWRLVAPA
jgi:TctA family transporter